MGDTVENQISIDKKGFKHMKKIVMTFLALVTVFTLTVCSIENSRDKMKGHE